MKIKIMIVSIFILLNVFGEELKYSYFNIYNTEKYTLNQENYDLSTKYLDFNYSRQNYKIDTIKLNPENINLILKTKYYNLNYSEFKFNLEDYSYNDEIVGLEFDDFKFKEHTIKIPYSTWNVSYSLGENDDSRFKLTNDTADLTIDEFNFKKEKIEIGKKDISLAYSDFNLSGNLLLNDVSDIGDTYGNFKEYSLSFKKSKGLYRKFDLKMNADIDNKTTYLITTLANHYIYGKVELNLENFEYQQIYEKNFDTSKLKITNYLGIIKNNDSSVHINEQYFKDVLSFIFIKVKKKVMETEKEISLGSRYSYYNFTDIGYEKKVGNFYIGINKIIPLFYEKENAKESEESEESSSTAEETTNPSQSNSDNLKFWEDKDKIKELIFSGTKLYLKYEF